LIDGAYHLLFAVGYLSALREIDRTNVGAVLDNLADAFTVVKNAVDKEKSDPAFAYKRFFKSTRAKKYVEDEAVRFVENNHV
jgi:hypothetical protein